MFLEEEYNVRKVIGVDEVGRGPLAGPVVACAFYYNGSHKQFCEDLAFFKQLNVTDSKKLTHLKRQRILSLLGVDKPLKNKRYELKSLKGKACFAVQESSVKEIDKINILQAALKAMSKCIDLLVDSKVRATIWIDGNIVPSQYKDSNEIEAIVKGDEKSFAIGMASIIAKEYRDHLMLKYARRYPHYYFEKNAGYPTKDHKIALINYGVTPIHRKTFKGVKELL